MGQGYEKFKGELQFMKTVITKKTLKRACIFLILSIVITIAAAGITYNINPNIDGVMNSFNNQTADPIKETKGLSKVWEYILNNGLAVPLQMFIFSLIPIQFLYLINIVITVTLPGILFGIILQYDSEIGVSMIMSSVPHYLFEVFAFCIFAGVLFELNKSLRHKIKTVFKKEKQELFIGNSILRTAQIYLLLVLPLIVTAAFLETYVADAIYKML